MKRSIFIILLSFVIITTKSQTYKNGNKILFATTFGRGIPVMDKPAEMSFTWQMLGYYNLTERWSLGAGTGLSFYEKMLIPMFGNIKFQIGPVRKITPYVELGTGYAFAPSNNANGGFFMNPSFGIQYPLKNKLKLQFAIGAELQKLERLKTQTDNNFRKEFTERLNHHAFSLKIGLIL